MDAKTLLLGSPCLIAPFADAATLDNALSACLAVRPGTPHTAEGQLHLLLTLEARRSTGEYGCTLALVRYRLLTMRANAKAQVLQEGLLDGRCEGAHILALATDAQLAADSTLMVRLGYIVAGWPSANPARFAMHLLYPPTPDRSSAVDELFAEEYDTVRSASLACPLFCDEELESGRLRAYPELPANTQVLYRGWTLTPKNYVRLHGTILVAGGRPLIGPQQYRHCHYLPEWYPLCEDLTPTTLFLSRNTGFEAVLTRSP